MGSVIRTKILCFEVQVAIAGGPTNTKDGQLHKTKTGALLLCGLCDVNNNFKKKGRGDEPVLF